MPNLIITLISLTLLFTLSLIFPLSLTHAQPAASISPTCTGAECTTAGGEGCSGGGVKTTLGCVSAQPKDLFSLAVRLASGIGGAVALLLMISGAFKMLTSGGNSIMVREGRNQFISAAIGLVFTILAVALLQIIGVDILNLPGFSR
jgi:hypothetical protein